MKCRFCKKTNFLPFLDLGHSPLANGYLNHDMLDKPEMYFPLQVKVCLNCWLTQTIDFITPKDVFTSEYAYCSSASKSWLKHAEKLSSTAIESLNLNEKSFVVEIGSNDGYLLKNFVHQKIPCLGIEPSKNIAKLSLNKKINTINDFFTQSLAEKLNHEGMQADLIIANNVYAHVPDIVDFTIGMKRLLKSNGTIILEFPHLQKLISLFQFDTVYHEHFSYFSLSCVNKILKHCNLKIYRVDELKTHGGSLRVYAHHEDFPTSEDSSLKMLIDAEYKFGISHNCETYIHFQQEVNNIKIKSLYFMLEQKIKNKSIIGYGAAAKGNTFINFTGIKKDLLPYICDISSSKQGKFLPGSHIPIVEPTVLKEIKPDYIIVFPWNLKDEIVKELDFIRGWGGKFVSFIPKLTIY